MEPVARRRKGFIWPNDGRRRKAEHPEARVHRSRFDGFKDILTGKGPDIHVGDINDRWGRPHFGQWARWPEWDRWTPYDNFVPAAPWARRDRKRYDLKRRKYRNWGADRGNGPQSQRDGPDSAFDFGPYPWERYWQRSPFSGRWFFI